MSQIHELIPKIMGEVGAIEKGRRNQQQNYAFRGIDDAYAAFQPLFAKHGVFCVPTVIERIREERENKNGGVLIYTTLMVRHTFYASDGSGIECVTIGEAMDSGDKSSNKAMSAAMKYALLEVFCVPTEADNDTENHSPEPLPRQPAQQPPQAAPQPKPATSTHPQPQNAPMGKPEDEKEPIKFPDAEVTTEALLTRWLRYDGKSAKSGKAYVRHTLQLVDA